MLTLPANPAWLTGVQYDAGTRAHRLDGRPALSVTQALSLAHPDRFAHVPPAVLARAAARGTAVHAAAQYALEGDLDAATVAPEIQPRLDAWQWFCATRRVEPLLSEAVVCSRDPLPFVGRLDYLCLVDRTTVVLLDVKTGTPDLARLQTLAYLDALYEQYPSLLAVDIHRWAVELRADGRYVIHSFRDDVTDARDLRTLLQRAYEVSGMSQHPDEPPFELPTEDDDPLFDLPAAGPLMPFHGPAFELPPDEPAPVVGLLELSIQPDVDAYLTHLERAVAPYEAAALDFAADMETASIETAAELQWLGAQSLVAKEHEDQIDALFDPAIRKPRTYLDRVYAVRRRVLEGWQRGGKTAAKRYTERQRTLEAADRQAQAEADKLRRVAQQQREQEAADARRQLAEAATEAAKRGDMTAVADLVEMARDVLPALVAVPAPILTAPAPVAGLSERRGWDATITDIKEAILAAARPDIYREVAQAIADGDLTAGGTTMTTEMIAAKLRAMALDLPFIPSTLFAGNDAELKKRAAADRDTLHWPGFAFTETSTPVRRPRAAR